MDNPQHSLDAVALRLNALAERCEAATEGQQSGLIWEAGAAIFGTDEPTDSHSAHAWFVTYAQAEAWIDAVMMLVPEGLELILKVRSGQWRAIVWPANRTVGLDGNAQAAALALCAAALRARAGGSNDTQP